MNDVNEFNQQDIELEEEDAIERQHKADKKLARVDLDQLCALVEAAADEQPQESDSDDEFMAESRATLTLGQQAAARRAKLAVEEETAVAKEVESRADERAITYEVGEVYFPFFIYSLMLSACFNAQKFSYSFRLQKIRASRSSVKKQRHIRASNDVLNTPKHSSSDDRRFRM